MEYYNCITLFVALLIITLHFLIRNPRKSKLPPGPKPWPIIGNIHLLGSKPHRSVADLSKTYGPLMTLRLGSITTIVISSPDVAKEMFLKHDVDFASRQIPDCVWALDHAKLSMAWLPVCPKWRELRKISAIQLFTNHRLDASQGLRKKKVNELVEFVKGCCEKGLVVDIGKAAFTTALNLLSNTFFSMDLCAYDSSGSQEFKDLAWHIMEEIGRPNISDFFPLIKALDLQGVKRSISTYFSKMLEVFDKIIHKRLSDQIGSKDDVLDALLNLVKQNELTLDNVRHMLIDLFVAGTDTTSNTIEWALTELLRHPEKMTKAQAEIEQLLEKGQSRSIQESDISKLPYIQAIVKETMRLHPAAPFLIPRKATTNIELCGYWVPKNAQVWVNVWSMGRDPSVWPDFESFTPERFLESEIDIRGRDFELMPFGTGRRICPGMPLAYRMLHLMLATFLHSFNWKLDNGLSPEEVDMEEKFGVALAKVQPLQAIPFPR
uniref:Cytochrome P450 monooxygenase CYP76AD-2 n=1 Tax=Lophophora williamsii TaxID=130138 RepID=A0AA51VK86_LOPWI|nr:cytochrome P450 monooxygenase CYP76AD-2 [Lophophora williamsii]